MVKEGDLVDANQPLVRLDETAVNRTRRLTLQRYRLLATSARLTAEIGASDQIQLPPMLRKDAEDPVVQVIFQAQEAEFGARRTSLLGQEAVLKKEIGGLQEGIRGYELQVTSNQARLSLFDEEFRGRQR